MDPKLAAMPVMYSYYLKTYSSIRTFFERVRVIGRLDESYFLVITSSLELQSVHHSDLVTEEEMLAIRAMEKK